MKYLQRNIYNRKMKKKSSIFNNSTARNALEKRSKSMIIFCQVHYFQE